MDPRCWFVIVRAFQTALIIRLALTRKSPFVSAGKIDQNTLTLTGGSIKDRAVSIFQGVNVLEISLSSSLQYNRSRIWTNGVGLESFALFKLPV